VTCFTDSHDLPQSIGIDLLADSQPKLTLGHFSFPKGETVATAIPAAENFLGMEGHELPIFRVVVSGTFTTHQWLNTILTVFAQ
jgi:hypothetical protein